MKKIVTFPRAATLLCSSLAILLTACGGGDAVDAGPALEARAAATAAGSDSALAQPAGVPGEELNTAAPAASQAAASAAEEAAAPSAAPSASTDAFALAGYEDGPFVEDNGSQPATVLAAATVSSGALADGTVTPAVVVPATTYKLYVSPSGNDNNTGSATSPFRTLARAANSTRPSTTVFVAPGTYSGGFKTTIHGSSSGHIYYVSTTKWGARIVGSSATSFAWDNRGNYVDIVGFQVDGSGATWRNGIYNGGSYDTIRGNWVHHIGKSAACNGSGGSAINIDHYYYGVQSNVVGNLVNDIGPTGCRYIQGIYVSTTGTVKNNVVYRVAEAAIHLWHDARSVIITNNTVTTSHTGIIVGGGDFYHVSGPSDYNRVYSNIVYDNASGVSEQGSTGTNNTYRNNLVYGNSSNWSLRNGLTHTATVTSAPYFVYYTRTGTPNLRLTSSSPAIGRATSGDALPYDFLERPRNSTTGYDIGAYQH